MKIETKNLQKLVGRVAKGVGNNPLLPLTSLIQIKCEGGSLSLETFDGFNYITSKETVDGTDSFSAVTSATPFINLVNKTTSKEIEITHGGSHIAFRGNGNYKLEIVMDNGTPLAFPEHPDFSDAKTNEVSLSTFLKSIEANESSAAKVDDVPFLKGCYFGDSVITTNNSVICSVEETLIEGESMLFMYQTLRLLPALGGEKVRFAVTEGEDGQLFAISDADTTIYGKFLEGVEKYPVKALKKLLDLSLNGVAIGVDEALSSLDRINIFASQYEIRAINLHFEEGSITISNVGEGNGTDNAVEEISVYEAKDGVPTDNAGYIPEPFDCTLDLVALQSDLKVCPSKKVCVFYGSDKFLKIKDGKIDFVIACVRKVAK